MTPDRSLLVILVAAAMGAVLGRGAGAVVDRKAPVAAVAVGALAVPDRSSSNAPAAGPSSSAVEGEPDEPRPDATGENPYEDTPPAHPAPFRIQVPMRDGMLKLPGGHFVMGSCGCGSGCHYLFMWDAITGEFHPQFPFGPINIGLYKWAAAN